MMKSKTIRSILFPLLVLTLLSTVLAITWFPTEITCPVCQTKNKFLTPGSWGSYIYSDPSKYQLIFWPLTDSPTVYSCRKCYLSAFMWDFEKVPKEKIPEIKKVLEGVKLEQPKPEKLPSGDAEAYVYTKIPIQERLKVAEKVYSALGEDENFWCQFYRVVGYHYDGKDQQAADDARKKALGLCEKMLGDKKHAGVRKELLYISGAMKHFLRDDQGALNDFNEALKTKYENKEMDAEKNKNANENLNGWLNEYLKGMQGPKKPREIR